MIFFMSLISCSRQGFHFFDGEKVARNIVTFRAADQKTDRSTRMTMIRVFASMEEASRRLVANRPQLLLVDGIRICLVLREGELRAVQDKCTHNGESLSKGAVNYLGEVVCPWHGYRFDLRTGRESDERSRDLVTYPISTTEEGVFINI
jgi:nitrite reductase/ring-hydroxylating ferredoxin subunit